MKQNYAIIIQDWMIHTLKLKGVELLCYAIINDELSKTPDGFNVSVYNLAKMVGASNPATLKAIKKLTGKGIIIHTEKGYLIPAKQK